MKAQRLIRKIHIYGGISLVLPLFIFTVSGFMLNHRWKPWNNFDSRIESVREAAVHVPQTGARLEKASAVLRQLGVESEINTLVYEPEKDYMLIRAVRPGTFLEITVTLSSGAAVIRKTDLTAWSLLNDLHTFTGLHSNIPEKKNWFWTKIWSIVIDLTALVMLLLLGTGLYMWTKLKNERRTGLLLLEFGGALIIILIWIISAG